MRGPKDPGVPGKLIAALIGCVCGTSLVWSHGAEDSHGNRLKRVIAANDSYELCLVLARDQSLHYAFSAPRRLDFNIHYHDEHEIFYPVSRDQIMDAKTTFSAQSEQEYCLMWTNQGDTDVPLILEYNKNTSDQPLKD